MSLIIGSAATVQNKGAYSAAVTYLTNDVVTYLGGTYLALVGSTGTAPTNGATWALVANPGTGVPAGGAAGKVLTKASSSDYDYTWASPLAGTGGGQFSYAIAPSSTPQWFDNRYFSSGSGGTYTASSKTIVFIPIYTGRAYQVTGLATVSASTNTGSTLLGIYSGGNAGQPGSLLVSTSVTLAATNTVYSSTFSAVTMPAGLNFLAMLPLSAAQQVALVATSVTLIRPMQAYSGTTGNSSTVPNFWISSSTGYSAFSNSGPPVVIQSTISPQILFLAST